MNDAKGKSVELEPDSEPAFEKRQVEIKKNRWITDDFEVLEFLGRSVRLKFVNPVCKQLIDRISWPSAGENLVK